MPTHQILATEEMVGAGHATKADTLNRFINLIAAKGDLLRGSAAATAAKLAIGTANFKLFVNAAGDDIEWAAGLYLGTFTRDMTGANGDVAYTGTGFKPTEIIFLASDGTTPDNSIGFDNATVHYALANVNGGAASTTTNTASIIVAANFGVTSQAAIVKTMDANGFTLTWTKTGAPGAGAMTVYYLAIR